MKDEDERHDDVGSRVSGSRYLERPAPSGFGLACVWTRVTDGAHDQLVVPDGCMDLIWSEGASEVLVAGPDTGPQVARLSPGARLTGVRFRPGAAPHVLGVPADLLRDARIGLPELWRSAGVPVAEEAAAGDPVGALLRMVAGGVRRAGPADPSIDATVAALASGASVAATAGRLGLSERHLRRRCLGAFGYGPKTLQRILRFQRALTRARAGQPPARIAHSEGYADQAHLANEVRALAGSPLGALR